jgi:hypothetical protein
MPEYFLKINLFGKEPTTKSECLKAQIEVFTLEAVAMSYGHPGFFGNRRAP